MNPADNLHSKQKPSRTTEPLWTVEDVAEYLRLKPETVRTMARDGKIPCTKVGRAWRFKSREISEWVATKNP